MRRIIVPHHEYQRRGLNITELAIVLAVIGTVLAAIWVTAAQIRKEELQTQFSDQLAEVVSNIRSVYSAQNSVTQSSVSTTMAFLLNTKAFPADSLHVGSSSTSVDSPWGEFVNPSNGTTPYNSLYACGWPASTTVSTTCFNVSSAEPYPYIAIEVIIPIPDACIGAVVRNSGIGAIPGLVNVFINGTKFINAAATPPVLTFPVTPSFAQTNCTAFSAGNNVALVDFVYSLSNSQ